MKLIQKIFTAFKRVRSPYPYVIEEIDLTSQAVIIRCSGTRMTVKYKLAAIITDNNVLSGLDPVEASTLGGCYGRILRATMEGRNALRTVRGMNFLLKNKQGRYQIVYQNRDGTVGYYDKKTKKSFSEHPLAIVNNRYIIAEFDPSQACYIGLLAGISVEKALSAQGATGFDKLLQKTPNLRIID